MHIIIPMSGIGKRFLDANYKDPKPLIRVDGKPIIAHVCDLFPSENKFTFICNSKHLRETNMREILLSIKPNANIIEIPNHKKGPVYATTFAFDSIDDDEEVIVNYCDFGTYWDYNDFLSHTRNRNADGAIPAYKGFHPHMLGSTNYAFMRDDKQWMLEIKEKEPFTDNRMQEFASNGTYYFKKGSYIKKYFTKLMQEDINLKGEYYISLVYNLMLKDKLKISIYEIQHMLQWGKPEDLEEYQSWSNYFKNLTLLKDDKTIAKNTYNLIPLAGKGSRFSKVGYQIPKPLLLISGKEMIVQAASSLPKAQNYIFVALQEHLDKYNFKKVLENNFLNSKIVSLDEVTEGQAITCLYGLEDANDEYALFIAASDNSMIYDENKYQDLINDEKTDAIVFTFKHHISSKNNPNMYGWVEVDDKDNALNVSVKKAISNDPYNDHAIVGAFWFKKVKYFKEASKSLIDKNIRINGEFYVDSLINELINKGLKVKVLEVENYICWGTPNDYETFNYWQSFFHKNPEHPYDLSKDKNVKIEEIENLDNEFRNFKQEYR